MDLPLWLSFKYGAMLDHKKQESELMSEVSDTSIVIRSAFSRQTFDSVREMNILEHCF